MSGQNFSTMGDHSEDKNEEREFRSLKPYDQQRYLNKIQEMDKCFRDMQSYLKKQSISRP